MAEGKIGASEEEVTALIQNVNKAYQKFYGVFKYQIPTGLINPLSNTWFSEDAIKYTTAFAEDATQVAQKIYESCQSIVKAINGTARSMWAAEGGAWADVAFTGEPVTVTADNVKDIGPAGFKGIENVGTMQAASKNAKALQSNIEEAVQGIISAAGASGFYGGGVAESLSDALAQVTPGYTTSYENLTNAIDKAIEEKIESDEANATASRITVGGN